MTLSDDLRTLASSNATTDAGCTTDWGHAFSPYGGGMLAATFDGGDYATRGVDLWSFDGITNATLTIGDVVTYAEHGIAGEPAVLVYGDTNCVMVTRSAVTGAYDTAIMSTSVAPFTNWTQTVLAYDVHGAQMTITESGRIYILGRHYPSRRTTNYVTSKPCVTALWEVFPSAGYIKVMCTFEDALQDNDKQMQCGYGQPMAIGETLYCVFYSDYKIKTAVVDTEGI